MSGAVERSPNLKPDKDLQAGAGENAALSGNGNFERRPHLETRRALRTWAQDKPQIIRNRVSAVCWELRELARQDSPSLRAALADNLRKMEARR